MVKRERERHAAGEIGAIFERAGEAREDAALRLGDADAQGPAQRGRPPPAAGSTSTSQTSAQ